MELRPRTAPFPHLRGGRGAAVVLVPGLGGTTDFWAAQLPLLAARYTVLAFDQRGSGARAAEPPCHAPEEIAADVAAILDEVADGPAVLVGHSMGAAVCQYCALSDASRLGGLVLSSAWASPDPGFRALIARRRRVLETEGAEPYLALSARLALPASAPDRAPDPADLKRRAQALDVAAELARLDALHAHDLHARVGAIKLPVEVLAAADDRLTPPAMSEDLAERLPHARLTLLEHGGHVAPRSNAEAFSAALLRSLARLLPPHPRAGLH